MKLQRTLSLILLLFVLWLAGADVASAASSITITPEDYNAGDLTKAPAIVTKVFRVSNSGDSTLSIAKIKYT